MSLILVGLQLQTSQVFALKLTNQEEINEKKIERILPF